MSYPFEFVFEVGAEDARGEAAGELLAEVLDRVAGPFTRPRFSEAEARTFFALVMKMNVRSERCRACRALGLVDEAAQYGRENTRALTSLATLVNVAAWRAELPAATLKAGDIDGLSSEELGELLKIGVGAGTGQYIHVSVEAPRTPMTIERLVFRDEAGRASRVVEAHTPGEMR
jgi:hypothetical protein